MLPSLAFLLAALVLALTPGPGIAYVVARTVAGGRAEGLASCVGTGLGGMLHVGAAALGLSLLLAQSAAAFAVLKWVGAAYLVYLGVRLLLSRSALPAPKAAVAGGPRRALLEGILVEALNVKTALFFLAFLPQFVRPENGSVMLQLMTLGIIFVLLGLFSTVVFAVSAGRLGNFLRRNPSVVKWQGKVVGGIYCALGVRLALQQR